MEEQITNNEKFVELSATIKLSDILKMCVNSTETSSMDATASSEGKIKLD